MCGGGGGRRVCVVGGGGRLLLFRYIHDVCWVRPSPRSAIVMSGTTQQQQ